MKKKPEFTADEILQVKLALRQLEEQRKHNAAIEVAASRMGDCQGERGPSIASMQIKAPTPIEMVDDAAGRVGSLASRISNLAARLVGEVPTGSDAKPSPERAGQLGTVADRAENIFYAVNAMHAAIDRIEQQLP